MRIKADLRPLVDNQPTTTLSDKVFSAANTLPVGSVTDFASSDYVLIGSLGSENTEIRKISTISNQNIVLTAVLTFDHSQDSAITRIGYDKVAFYYSATVTGSLGALAAAVSIVPDGFYTAYDDVSNSTGYGWFKFYNSTTAFYSDLSNAVPYADFAENSVKKMLDRFYTQIGNRERKMIRDIDVIEWMNEAYTIALNRLNLVNREYSVPTPATFNIVAGTTEYALPDSFFKVRSFSRADGTALSSATIGNITSTPSYYLRGSFLGMTPAPTAPATYFLYYSTTSPVLRSYIDYMDLPGNNFYFILDYLLYRATPLIGGDAVGRLKLFNNGLEGLVLTAHRREGGASSWGRDLTSFV